MTLRPSDHGSATVEFIALSVLLLIPAVYLLITISQLQAAGYAAVAASDQAAKALAYADNDNQAESQAISTVHLTAEDYQIDPARTSTAIQCSNTPCSSPGTQVTVAVSIEVPLPLMPTFMGNQTRIATMDATGYHVIGEFE